MLITVQPTTDTALIDSVMAALRTDVTSDQHDKVPAASALLATPNVTVLAFTIDGANGGIVVLAGDEVHTLFLPVLRGSKAIQAAEQGLAWIWANTGLESISSYVLGHRREVLMFTRMVGFTATSTVDLGDTVNGVPVTRTYFTIRRP